MAKIMNVPQGAPALAPSEAKLLEEVAATRRPTFLGRLIQGFNYAFGTIDRAEFDRVCLKIVEEIDKKPLTPDGAAEKAQRLLRAYTQAQASVMVAKCDYSERAILLAYLGDPQRGFLFQKSLTLADPRGVKRG